MAERSEWYVDSDNALGALSGDVDDGFALAALFLSRIPITAVGAVYGNTAEPVAFENHRRLADRCGYPGAILRGAPAPQGGMTEASQFLRTRAERHWRVLALGPVTNIAQACRAGMGPVAEVVVVGGNSRSPGRWPPYWPFEFNLTQDPEAMGVLFESSLPLTVVPLNVCGRLRVSSAQLAGLPGDLGRWLEAHSRRGFRRPLWRKVRRQVPLWDLAAAMYVIDPSLFRVEKTTAEWHERGWLRFGAGTRPVTLVRDFSPEALWARFERLFPRAG